MKTLSAKAETVQRSWYLVDAKDKVLGRLASQLASRLRGKHKPQYTPHVDVGDYIVVINADNIKVTANKYNDKQYYHYTGYPSGIKQQSFAEMQARHPGRVIELAVKGMLPKNSLGRSMFSKLKVYAGADHPHTAQQPELIEL